MFVLYSCDNGRWLPLFAKSRLVASYPKPSVDAAEALGNLLVNHDGLAPGTSDVTVAVASSSLTDGIWEILLLLRATSVVPLSRVVTGCGAEVLRRRPPVPSSSFAPSLLLGVWTKIWGPRCAVVNLRMPSVDGRDCACGRRGGAGFDVACLLGSVMGYTSRGMEGNGRVGGGSCGVPSCIMRCVMEEFLSITRATWHEDEGLRYVALSSVGRLWPGQ